MRKYFLLIRFYYSGFFCKSMAGINIEGSSAKKYCLAVKKTFFLFPILLSAGISFAQFTYRAENAQNTSGAYSDLGASGSPVTTNFAAGAMTFDDDNSSIQNIGFNFIYNGTTFTQFVLNSNGFIKLGVTAPTANNYDVLNFFETNTIAPFNYDLDGGTAPEYRVLTSGSAGSRVCTIQFKNLRDWVSSLPSQYANINFQIKLYETSNNIEFVYGSFTAGAASPSIFSTTAGITGTTVSSSVNVTKASTTAWSSSTFINDNYTGNKLNNKNDVLPTSGRIFRFVAALTDAQVETYTLGQIPVSFGSPHIIKARVKNNGTTTLTNLSVTLSVTGANTFTNSKLVTLASQATAVVSFDPFSPTVLGSNTVAVSVPADNISTNNNSYYALVATGNIYSHADASSATGAIGFNTAAGLLLTKYTLTGTSTVTNVKVHLSTAANTGNTVYAVVLNAAGTIVGQSANYVTVAGDLGAYKNFVITSPPSLSNTDFYVGLAQTANATTGYYPLSTQTEADPAKPGAYYYTGLGGGVPTENGSLGRFMIQAVLSGGATPPSDPYTNSYWTWMKGDNTPDVAGVYGTPGVAAANNNPGAREGSVSWTDTSGNLWLFGGLQYTYGQLNDLWKYSISTGQWTWVKGDNTEDNFGVYGALGVAATGNKPGSRSYGVSWTDNAGDLWLFGGYGYGNSSNGGLNDLWKYNIASNKWTWIKGDSAIDRPSVFGSQGVAAPANKPGFRDGSVSWKDNAGNLWLFGGDGGDVYHFLNDLWKYDISSNQWTWMKGDMTSRVLGVYGTLGVPAAGNKPGSRIRSVSWKDNSGNLWLFGGEGLAHSGASSGSLNDLWKYDVLTDQWTWVKGDSIRFVGGVYGTKGVAAAGNKPGSREKSISWTDGSGNLWLFGGFFPSGESDFNDLWKYEISSNQWTWVKGDNGHAGGLGIYGTKGVEASANKPGGRHGSVSWIDAGGNFWLFGGTLYNPSEFYNDLWKVYGGASYVFTGDGDWDIAGNWINNLIGPKNPIPGGVSVIIDNFLPGSCQETGDISIQLAGKLTIQPTKRLTLINGNLSNAGQLNGSGTVTFSGSSTALSSPGSITAPLILSSKQVFLTGNTNTKSIELSGGSNITLNNYDLKMDTGTLVGNSSNYIITNSTGRLSRVVPNTNTAIQFHVGQSGTSYTPATVTNSGTTDTFSVRVGLGVESTGRNNTAITSGNVNRTWYINEGQTGGSNANLTLQWGLGDEQGSFTRTTSYISHFQVCPPPDNCTSGYWDVVAASAAAVPSANIFTQTRTGITSFSTPSFVVTSQTVFSFTNEHLTGFWDDPLNWLNGRMPPIIVTPAGIEVSIPSGMEVVINPQTGQCNLRGTLNVQQGGILTISPGKILNIIRN